MLACCALPLSAQQELSLSALPEAPAPSFLLSEWETAPTALNNPQSTSSASPQPHSTTNLSQQQPKRILGFMPNYRAVSAGEIPPPPSPRQAFHLATVNSFDYSSILFGGLTSLLAEGTNTHPDLGKGVPGFWGYYWRGFLDKTDGNYLVIYAMPSLTHEDLRYYALGHGGFKRRVFYAASSVLIARDYQGRKVFSISEVAGRGAAQGLSLFYYSDQDNTVSAVASRYGYSIGRDAITATFREFWPDIATHILHRNP